MKITKEELIEEIKTHLNGLETIAELSPQFKLSETLALLDLQFRLKCKLYELTNESGVNEK